MTRAARALAVFNNKEDESLAVAVRQEDMENNKSSMKIEDLALMEAE
jgi:hypothetical protein